MTTPKHCAAAAAYLAACEREQCECALEFINALNSQGKECILSARHPPLTDQDICCLADALRCTHTIRVLDLEENNFGLLGIQTLLDAVAANSNVVRELRLGKNKLKDPSAVVIGNALSLNGLGLKVLDLSENGITKLGCMSLCQAVGTRACDLVELSLHNNALESDAALSIAQALRSTPRLKHLHLGYNNLRDIGATHLARTLPIVSTLSTLDLTSNRIGSQGGQEIARALVNGSCTLQRLNLRHNNFDDDTLCMFEEVVLRNTSLTQLFLGFMNASGETTHRVLSALRHNRSMNCLDIFSWSFDAPGIIQIVEEVMFSNSTIRAVITDEGDMLQELISVGNVRRVEKGWPQVYIGGDDQAAAHAAASRSASRATSVTAMPPQSVSQSRPQPDTFGTYQQPKQPKSANGDDIDVLLSELQHVQCEPELRNRLLLIISQLQLKMEIQRSYQQQQIIALEERVRTLEQRSKRESPRRAPASAPDIDIPLPLPPHPQEVVRERTPPKQTVEPLVASQPAALSGASGHRIGGPSSKGRVSTSPQRAQDAPVDNLRRVLIDHARDSPVNLPLAKSVSPEGRASQRPAHVQVMQIAPNEDQKPELQQSKHTAPTAMLESIPRKQDKLRRPQGCRQNLQ